MYTPSSSPLLTPSLSNSPSALLLNEMEATASGARERRDRDRQMDVGIGELIINEEELNERDGDVSTNSEIGIRSDAQANLGGLQVPDIDLLRQSPCPSTPTKSSPSNAASRESGNNSTSASPAPSSSSGDDDSEDHNFDCNICLYTSTEPVITLCGHLYCWPCLYRWLSNHSDCPVCKAGVTRVQVIPLYGRGCKRAANPNADTQKTPRRPSGQRPSNASPPPTRAHRAHSASNAGFSFGAFGPQFNFSSGNNQFSFSAGSALFPALFGLQFTNAQWGSSQEEGEEEEQEDTRFSRFLMSLGFFMLALLLMY